MPPQHGGDLLAASERYGIAPSDWLDLSTGVNPRTYPVPAIDLDQFRQLPSDIASLGRAAQDFCEAPITPDRKSVV